MSVTILLEVQNDVAPAVTRCGACDASVYLIRIFPTRKNHFKVLLCDIRPAALNIQNQLIFRPHACDPEDARMMRRMIGKPEITMPGDGELNRRRPKGCGETAGFDRRFEVNESLDPDKGGDA